MTYTFMQPMQQKKRSLSPMHCFRGYLPHPRPQRSHARVVSTSLMGVLRLLHRGIAVLIEEDRVRAFRDYITEDEDSDKQPRDKDEEVCQGRSRFLMDFTFGRDGVPVCQCTHKMSFQGRSTLGVMNVSSKTSFSLPTMLIRRK